MRIRAPWIQISFAAVLALSLAACGAEKRAGPPPLGGQPGEEGVDEFRGEAGPRTSDQDSFPISLPVPANARLIASIEQQGRGHVRTYRTPDSPDDVSSFYLGRLREEGWSVDFDGLAEGMPLIALSRGDERIRISIERSGDGSLFHMAAAPTR